MVRRFYRFGPFVLDPVSATLSHKRKRVPLTPKMSDTLLLLVQSGRRVLGKRELIGMLWPNSFVEENNLTQNICRLRYVLARASRRRYIETVPKRGYRFTARVKEFWGQGDDSGLGKPGGPPAIAGLEQTEVEKWKANGSVQPVKDATLRSVAVLPFESLDAKSDDECLRLGLFHCLIARLSRINQLTVRSPGGILKHYDGAKNPVAACRKLRAHFLLQGQFQRFDNRIRVTSQLVRVSDEVLVWAGKFDQEFTDMFSVQDSISEQVAHAFSLEFHRSTRDKNRLPAIIPSVSRK